MGPSVSFIQNKMGNYATNLSQFRSVLSKFERIKSRMERHFTTIH